MTQTNPYLSNWDALWAPFEFYNKCHNPSGPDGGQFCSGAVDSGNLSASEKKSVSTAFSAIQEVHELPKGLTKVYVEMTDSDVIGSNVDGTYNSGEDRILLNSDKANNAITFVHEFGHHLSLSGEGNFSANQFQDRIDRSNPLRAWRDAVHASDTIQGIKELRTDPYFEYLLDDREIFARSYTQWIVKNSNNATLKRQFEELDVNMKWSDKEFEPIARTLDRIFTYERMSRGDFSVEAETLLAHGTHDQSTHGNWAPDAGALEGLRTLLKNKTEGPVDISAFSDFDIPRHQMPQLRAVPEPGSKGDKLKKNKKGEVNVSPQFIEALEKDGIRSINTRIAPELLKPTQGEVDAAKVHDEAFDAPDVRFNPRSYVLISSDNYIVDGHHRWAGALVRNPDAHIPVVKVDLTAEELLPYTRAFTEEWGIQKKTILAHGNHDQTSHGNWARGRFQFEYGSKELSLIHAYDNIAQDYKSGDTVKEQNAAVRKFIDDVNTTVLNDPNATPASIEYMKAAERAWKVWEREREPSLKAEEAYLEAVNNPKVPEQLYNQDYAKAVAKRQVELATRQITSEDYLETHPEIAEKWDLREYPYSSVYREEDSAWFINKETGEEMSRRQMTKLAKEWIAENEARVEPIIERSDVYVRVEPQSLTRILQEGRIRTYHEPEGQETSISNHEGGNTPEMRRRIEEAYWGGEAYPIYGYLADDEDGFVDAESSHALPTVEAGLGFYGDIAIRLKPEVRDRTTYTLGDTSALFGGYESPVVVPQPVNAPSSLAGAHFNDATRSTSIQENVLQNFGKTPYWEAQILGGVSLADIDRITFAYPPPPEVQLLLEGRGIEWYSINTEQGTGYSAEEYGFTSAGTNPYLAAWNRLFQFHGTTHDESSHGNWADGSSDVTHGGLENFPEPVRQAILSTVDRLQKKYGLRVNVDARPSDAENGKLKHFNFAEELEAIAGVEPGETTIHINPRMADPKWIKRQLARKSFIAKTIEEAIIHEYAHSLHGSLEQQDRLADIAALGRPFQRATQNLKDAEDLRKEVSYYAGENPDEAIAEAFLQYEKGISNRWSDHVGETLARLFRKEE